MRALIVFLTAFLASLHAGAIAQPVSATFEAWVDEQVALPVEVQFDAAARIERLETRFSGFDFDRKILPLGGNRFRILIAPNTLHPARGIRAVMEVQGLPAGASLRVPIAGSVKAWITVQPELINLGDLWGGARVRRINLALRSTGSAAWEVTKLEMRGLPGAMAAVSGPDAGAAGEKSCAVEIDMDALAAGRRRGTILNGRIVIHTTHPRLPQIVLPVFGFVPR